jgi:hypothetical protein
MRGLYRFWGCWMFLTILFPYLIQRPAVLPLFDNPTMSPHRGIEWLPLLRTAGSLICL